MTLTIFSILILIMSVVIHEVAHGYAAYIQGDPTAYYEGRLTLNPLKHLDLFGSIIVPIATILLQLPAFGWAKPVPFNPYNLRNQRWGEFWVAIAGPLSNVVIACIFGLLVRFGLAIFSPQVIALSMLIVIINLWLAMFNLIPVPPLDGSKILYSFLPYQLSKYRYQFERYAYFVLLFLMFVPAVSTVLSIVVSFFFTLVTGHTPQSLGILI